MKYPIPIAALALLIALPAAAEVYRCDTDGVVTFSDRPCGPHAKPHSGGTDISFVVPDENLPALAEAAKAFIQARRERMNRRAKSDPNRLPRTDIRPQPAPTVYLPWPVYGAARPHRPRRGFPDAPPKLADSERYSALNGPILGTRRDIWLFDDRPASHAGERRR